jgi:hypothetical protein
VPVTEKRVGGWVWDLANLRGFRRFRFVLPAPAALAPGPGSSPCSRTCWVVGEGPAKKKRRTPPVHLLNPKLTHPPSDFFFLDFFFSTFLGVSRQGEFKNTIKIFLQKVHVENFFRKFDKKCRCQFFLDFFGFITFSGVPQRWELKNTTKNVLQKNRVEKILQKIRPKIQNRLVLEQKFITFLGVSR